MKYVRFQSQRMNDGTNSKLGIFQIAFDVRDADETKLYDANEINRHLRWLQTHLHSPDILDEREHFRAICWFKDTAHEPMKRVWAIKPFVEAYGYWIEMVKTWTPGHIIYEDGWQVVAKPYRSMQF